MKSGASVGFDTVADFWPSRCSTSPSSCKRDSTVTSRPTIAVSLQALAASFRQPAVGLCDAEARHRKQETRIDAVVARLDAFPAEHAGRCPLARRLGTIAGAHKVEHAADDVFGSRIRNSGGSHTRTNLDALAASRAGVEHVVDAFAQSRLERDVGHRLRQLSACGKISHAPLVTPVKLTSQSPRRKWDGCIRPVRGMPVSGP